GLTLAELAPGTAKHLQARRAGASVLNPVDLLGDAGPDDYADAVSSVLRDDNVDAVIVIHAPTLVADPDAVAAAGAWAADGSKPVTAVLVGRARGVLHGATTVPVFGSVEPAVAALGRAADHGEWRQRPERPNVPPEGIDRPMAVASVDTALR